MTAARALAATAGLAVVAWLVWETGPGLVLARMQELSWRLPVILLPSGLVTVIDAASWRYCFPGRLPAPTLLVPARLAGEAVNDTTPTGTLGGEPLKAWLLVRAGIPLEEGLVSVVVAKTVLVASQVGFLALGLAVAVTQPDVPTAVTSTLAGLVAAGAAAVAGLVWAQRRGLFRVGSRAVGWIGLGSVAAVTTRLDAELRAYYRARRGRLTGALAIHLAGWITGSLEAWLVLRFFGEPAGLATALVIEAWAAGIRSVGFLVPAAAGVQEGGLVAVFAGLGLGADAGLTFALVRRIREAVWILAGYGILATWPWPRPSETGRGTPGGAL